ncbi:hypothetical protein CTI12_AA091120 [Artemisia annua]|uniref:Uncharacterized protein n=1 Tax=Artemisia annua TaxID=35608 RepID=A0A2U1PZX1_ARTAN|nr:hypothetical protein CTI12_AA091120 [Artemisia annua]
MVLLQISSCWFPQRANKKLKDLNLGDLLLDGGEEGVDGDPNMSMNVLTDSGMANAAFLDELPKARLDEEPLR